MAIHVFISYQIHPSVTELSTNKNQRASSHGLMQIQVLLPFSSFLSFHLSSSFSTKFNKERLVKTSSMFVCVCSSTACPHTSIPIESTVRSVVFFKN